MILEECVSSPCDDDSSVIDVRRDHVDQILADGRGRHLGVEASTV